MKAESSLIGIVFFFLTGVVGCTTNQKDQGDFQLLPQPQVFEVGGVSDLNFNSLQTCCVQSGEFPVAGKLARDLQIVKSSKEADVVIAVNPGLDVEPEGYHLRISAGQVNIEAKDNAGVLYAFMTLEQIIQDAREQKVNLPLCSIIDYPELAYRAIHWDVKHHLEKKEYYYKLLDKLAAYKVNGVIVELEDKLKYESHPQVGSIDAFTPEEWKELSEYAKERNIEISPLVQGLGHASFILKHQKYKHLRDNPESDWAFNPLDPETYELQFDLYKEAIEVTPYGRYLHVGGDEVHTTGKGSGKTPLELQLIWLDKVCRYAEENGRIPIFWDDMPLKHAGIYRPMFNKEMTEEDVDSVWAENEHKLLDFLDRFPKNCIYMRWNYSAAEAIGNQKTMEWFREKDLKVMGATAGQTRWVLMPQEESNMNNIRSFAKSTIESGLDALLLTLWDDDSPHFELYIRGILAFAEYTWSGDVRSKEEIKRAYRQREFSRAASADELAFIDDLEIPVRFWKNALVFGNRRNHLQKMDDPAEQGIIELPDLANKGEWAKIHSRRLEEAQLAYDTSQEALKKIHKMKSKALRNQYSLEVYEQVAKLTASTTGLLLDLKKLDESANKEDEAKILEAVKQYPDRFVKLRSELEEVYGKTRVLIKPDEYILDQDHHVHLANQTRNFDWQFYPEILVMEKIKSY